MNQVAFKRFKERKGSKPLDPQARYSAPAMSLGKRPPAEKRFVAATASWRKPPPKKVAAPVIESDDSEDDEPLSKWQGKKKQKKL